MTIMNGMWLIDHKLRGFARAVYFRFRCIFLHLFWNVGSVSGYLVLLNLSMHMCMRYQ